MLKHNCKIIKFVLFILIITANISAASPEVEHEPLKIQAVLTQKAETDPAVITVPVVLTEEREIESLTIAIEFDADVLRPAEATLEGGILENRDYTLSSPINRRSATERRIVIYANDDMIVGAGEIVFITFEIIGDNTTELSLTELLCNAAPADGGFRAEQPLRDVQTDDALCQNVRLILGPDMNSDGRIGLKDAIHALQIVSGARTRECCLGDISLEKVIRALKIVTGIKK